MWLLQKRNLNTALKHFQRVVALDPRKEAALVVVAQILANSNDEADHETSGRIFEQLVRQGAASVPTLMSYAEFSEVVIPCREKSKRCFQEGTYTHRRESVQNVSLWLLVLLRSQSGDKWRYFVRFAAVLFKLEKHSRRGAKLVSKALKAIATVDEQTGLWTSFREDLVLTAEVCRTIRHYAVHCLGSRDSAKRKTLLEILVKSFPLEPELIIDIAEAEIEAESYGKAFSWIRRGLDRAPNNAAAQLLMAKLLCTANVPYEYEASPESLARRVLNYDPSNGDANLLLGNMLMSKGNYSQAMWYLQRSVVVGTDANAASAFLSIAEIHLVAFLKARSWYRLLCRPLPCLESPNLKRVLMRLNLANSALAYCLQVKTLSSEEQARALVRISIIQLLSGKILENRRGILNSLASLESIGRHYANENAEIWFLKGLCFKYLSKVMC